MCSEQLTLFPMDWREVVPLHPQPMQVGGNGGWCFVPFACKGDWIWNSEPGVTHVCTYPERPDSGFRRRCPIKPDHYFRGGAVDSVDLMYTISGLWVWVVILRELGPNDLVAYRDILEGKEAPTTLWPKKPPHYEDDDL